MKVLACIFGLVFSLFLHTGYACDLNHDWGTTASEPVSGLSTEALIYALIQKFSAEPEKGVLIGIDCIVDGEEYPLSLHYDGNTRFGILKKQLKDWKAEDLGKIAQEFQADYLLKVKLRNFHTTKFAQSDRYERNKDLSRTLLTHVFQVSCAVLSPEGKFLDFRDYALSVDEETVLYHKDNPASVVSYSRLNKHGKMEQKSNYLGLEMVEGYGQWIGSQLESLFKGEVQ
jgi:hypothetical protein